MKKLLILAFAVFICFTFCACDADNTESLPKAEYGVTIEVKCEANLLFSKYDVEVYVDDNYKGKVDHGGSGLYDLTLTEGKHTVKFVDADDSSLKGSSEINVSGNGTYTFEISCNRKGVTIDKLTELLAEISLPSSESSKSGESSAPPVSEPESSVSVEDESSVPEVSEASETSCESEETSETFESSEPESFVPDVILPESLEIECERSEIILGASDKAILLAYPENAETAGTVWTSSDEAVLKVESDGSFTAVGIGEAKIIVTGIDGVSAEKTIKVKDNKRLMRVSVSKKKNDNVTCVGSNWEYDFSVNGNKAEGKIYVAIGEQLEVMSEITEVDQVPDYGYETVYYVPTEEDVKKGFKIEMVVFVEENAGRFSGYSTSFTVTYTFKPA